MYKRIVTTGRQSLEPHNVPLVEAVHILWGFFEELKNKPFKSACLLHCVLISLFQQMGIRRSNRYILENSSTGICPLVCHWLVDRGGCFNTGRLNMPRSVFSPGSELLPQPGTIRLLSYQGKVASSEPVVTLRLRSGVVLESINWPKSKQSLSEKLQVQSNSMVGECFLAPLNFHMGKINIISILTFYSKLYKSFVTAL